MSVMYGFAGIQYFGLVWADFIKKHFLNAFAGFLICLMLWGFGSFVSASITHVR